MPRLLNVLLFVFLSCASAVAQLAPGDVFREYTWRPTNSEGLQRIIGFDATASGAKAQLPNPVLDVTITDLANATRVVVLVEKLTSHAGTRFPHLRVNGNAWIPIPEPPQSVIPGSRGSVSGPDTEFMKMIYPQVVVPLAHVKQGLNKFEFRCQSGTSIGRPWPQFIVYGTTFRVFYDSAKPRPNGRIISPVQANELGDSPTFEVEASSSAGIARVDLIGDYDDFDWRGDGVDRGWQYNYRYSQIRQHIGSATASPYRVTWDTSWIPTQAAPFQVIARIVDTTGINYITLAVPGLTLRRSKTVIRHRSVNIPKHWRTHSLAPRHSCDANVTADLTKADAAKMFLSTWNGWGCQEIGINGKKIVRDTGKSGDLSYDTIDVPVGEIQSGTNSLYTFSNLVNHGIEVNWPGIELFLRLNIPESQAQFVRFGTGCNGSAGVPELKGSGRPLLGTTFSLQLERAKANAIAVHTLGASNSRWIAIDLPFDLTPFGATGCNTFVSLDVFDVILADGSGRGQLPIAIPNFSSLIGLTLFGQFYILDAAANNAGLTVTNGVRLTVGDQ